MPPLVIAAALVLGAMLGSFLNVVIARVPAGQSIVRPRSRCPRCGTPIAWWDNVPVLSFLLLRGRCRACKEPISIRYLMVEVAIALATLFAVQRQGPSRAAAAELVLVGLLVALAAIDLETWLLPNVLTWTLLALGLAASALHVSPARSEGPAVLGAVLAFAAFAAISWGGARVFHKEALGFGDVWLVAGIGAWFGAGGLLPVVLLASLQGSIVGIAVLAAGRGRKGAAAAPAPDGWVPPAHAVPFGPFLAAAAIEWLYLAQPLTSAFPALSAFR